MLCSQRPLPPNIRWARKRCAICGEGGGKGEGKGVWGWDREDSIPPPPPVRQALDAPPGRRKENTTDLIYFTTPILPPSLGLKRELVKSEILLWVGLGGG